MATGNTQIALSTGQTIDIQALTGVVADDQHSSSTSLYSSGGGGYVGPHGGYVAAPQINSVTTIYQRIWITDGKGVDHELRIQNMEVPLRVGQRVTVYLAKPEGSSSARYEALFNHSTQLFFNWARDFTPRIRLTQGYRGSVLATLLVVLGLIFGGLSLFRHDQLATQVSNLRTRTPDCHTPNHPVWSNKAQRIAAEKAFADCKANIREIWVEYRKATSTYIALTSEAEGWVNVLRTCLVAVPIGGLIRWVRRTRYKRRVLLEYIDKLDATAGSGTLV